MTNKNKFRIRGIVLISLAFFALLFITNASAKLAFDNDCPVSSASNVNFSNGTAVSLPFAYTETSATNSNLTIFLGTNTDYFCSAINENLSLFSQNKTVIFTPEFLSALKTSSCSATFENYMENYRKSGDLLSSAGSVFCGIKNITFDAVTSPSGITFNYTIIGVPVGINGTHYNGPNLKKYMIAYLMNNPDVALSGVVSTFSEAISINLTAACPDADTITKFFNAGKGNYTTKFQPKLRGIDYGSGESLSPSDGVSGAFGWLLNFALGDQTLPIITAANLSTNKIYVCGINAIEEYYSNNTVTTSGRAVNITTAEINTSLEIKTNSDISNATIEIFEYTENPKASGALGVVGLNKYLGIKANAELENALSSVIIKVYYTDAEVSAAGLQEDTLRLYYYNTGSGSWTEYDDPNGGVNTTENYVWANTTHFSDWGIFGTLLSTSSGRHGRAEVIVTNESTCTIIWECAPWSQCINGMQARACNNAGTCNLNPVSETRSCIVTPIIPVTIPTSVPARTETTTTGAIGPTITGNAISNLLDVPLRRGLFSLIVALVIIGIISWNLLKKREFDTEKPRRRKRTRKTKKEVKRVRKKEKKAKSRKK